MADKAGNKKNIKKPILKKDASGLDGQYAVFGRVIQGMDVVDQIKAGDKMESVR